MLHIVTLRTVKVDYLELMHTYLPILLHEWLKIHGLYGIICLSVVWSIIWTRVVIMFPWISYVFTNQHKRKHDLLWWGQLFEVPDVSSVYSLFPVVIGVAVLNAKYKHITLILTALSFNKYCILGWEALQCARIYRLFARMLHRNEGSKFLRNICKFLPECRSPLTRKF
jgi:hypothetical protein